jgi:hypothetical protein
MSGGSVTCREHWPPGWMLSDPDPAKSKRVMKAMLQMKKIDIADLERAYQAG